MIAPRQRIASAYVVIFGQHGDVSRHARERGICRQWVYREAAWVQQALTQHQQQLEELQSRVRALEQEKAALQECLARSVVLDEEKQTQLAIVAQAQGVSLPVCWALLDVLIPGQQQSVATLGRRTKAAGEKAGQLLEVMDALARQRVREVSADEIYVKDAVLMTVEPESLCWLGGRLSDTVDGPAWSEELGSLPHLELVARDGGKGLEKGVALVNAARQARGQAAVVDQGDHFHALWGGGVGLRKAQARAVQALAAAEAAQKQLAECRRGGQATQGPARRAQQAWHKAEKAMDVWSERDRLWRRTKSALPLFTPQGDLNSRAQAEAVLAETLSRLPDSDFGTSKRQLQKPEMLNYLDRVHQQLQALPLPPEVIQAAVRQEGLRRRPEVLHGEGSQAAALRGVLLVCATILSKAGAVGQEALTAVRDIFRRAYRASSFVECINSVLRMQQSRHRKLTQNLLDLKRLAWNCHTFRTGRRRHSTPYQRLGIPLPENLPWWELLKLTPEQLQKELSTAKMAA